MKWGNHKAVDVEQMMMSGRAGERYRRSKTSANAYHCMDLTPSGVCAPAGVSAPAATWRASLANFIPVEHLAEYAAIH